jgi:hypothetical protein
MKQNTEKWLWTVLILLINVLLWAIPGNVAYLTAQQRDILLGRYSLGQFTALLVLVPVSAIILYLNWSNEKNKRKRQLQIVALSISIFVSILAMDVFLRLVERKNYVGQSDLYHRAPNTMQTGVTKDVPETAFSYPRSPPGFPDTKFTLTTDKRGFRNKTDLEKYDIATLGDSFTEGSGVSDDQTWPVLLAQKTALPVYNLAMSGGSPVSYLETFKKYALPLSPKIVICMLYEGNDFRISNFKKKSGLNVWFKSSPLRRILKNSLIRSFGSSFHNQTQTDNPDTDRAGPEALPKSLKALDWLPIAVPDDPNAKYYAFKVKALAAHYENKDKDTFLKSLGCQKTFQNLLEIKKICDEENIRFILAYAPDKPHVLLPLIKNKLTPDQLYEFLSLREKNLPPPKELMDIVLSRTNLAESATKEFCRQNSIEFVSLAEPLQKGIAAGRQLYFTYDQHWTPLGQQAAADTISHYLETVPAKPD